MFVAEAGHSRELRRGHLPFLRGDGADLRIVIGIRLAEASLRRFGGGGLDAGFNEELLRLLYDGLPHGPIFVDSVEFANTI